MPELPYDEDDMKPLRYMINKLINNHNWADADFVGLTFLDIEAEYFAAGEKEFR